MKSMTWGVVPTEDEFNQAFDAACPDGLFRVENDPAVGTKFFNRLGLYEMIKACVDSDNYACHDMYQDFASSAMAVLGFEWI